MNAMRVAQALLRACPGMTPALLIQQERQFVRAFDGPRPDPLELAPLQKQLREGGVDSDSVDALLLLIERCVSSLDREVILPPDTAALPAKKKLELVASIEPAFERQLAVAPPVPNMLAFDHTAPVDTRDLALATSSNRVATLLVLRGRSLGLLYKLETARILLGRAPTADLILDDDGISRFHAVITMEDGRFHIEDLGSKNGVIVNGFKVTSHALEEGDRVQLGANTLLKFALQDDVEEQFQQELYRSVTLDPLTGIYNRRHIVDRMRSECAYARRQGTPVSVLMIDLDHFKRVNDTYGHLAGDAVLRETAKAIHSTLRAEDIFGRYGGEELCAILRGIEAPNALLAGRRIVEIVRNNRVIAGAHTLQVTVSVGAATSVHNLLDTPQELIDAADRALYRAKNAGRDRCEAEPPPSAPPGSPPLI